MIYRVALPDGREIIAKESDYMARPVGADVGISWNQSDVVILSD